MCHRTFGNFKLFCINVIIRKYNTNLKELHIARMWLLLLVVACIPSGGFSLTETEWRDEIVRIYGMFTKYSNANQPAKLAALFTEDGEGLYPDTGVVGKDGLVLTEKQYHQERNFGDVYIGMAELLYTFHNVGVARHMAYDSNGPGHKGIMIFLADEDGMRIKMAIFNHN